MKVQIVINIDGEVIEATPINAEPKLHEVLRKAALAWRYKGVEEFTHTKFRGHLVFDWSEINKAK